MADKMFVACPKCGSYAQTERGGFFTRGAWKELTCPTCKGKYVYDEQNASIQECENCHTAVAYTQAHKDECPACHKLMSSAVNKRAIGCPRCTARVLYNAGDTSATCVNCSYTFDPSRETLRVENTVHNDAPDIRMREPMAPDHIVWRHPRLDMMPLNTCVIAESGTYALGIQGITQKFLVTGQSVKLSETELRYDASQYDGASVPMTNVDIFYIKRNLGSQIYWGNKVFLSDAFGRRTEFKVNGSVVIDTIEDPACFLRTFGTDPEEVLLSKFGTKPGPDGQPPVFTVKIRTRINSALQRALEVVRDTHGYTTDDMVYHKDVVIAEMERQANEAVAEYGLRLSNMTGEIAKGEIVVERDILVKRISGPISWSLERPVRVNAADTPTAWVDMKLNGRFYVEIENRSRFDACNEAYDWRDPSKSDNVARAEFTAMVQEELQSRVKADMQQIIDSLKCALDSVESYARPLASKAEALLNREDGYFASRGLRVRDVTVNIVMGAQSEVYKRMSELEDDTAIHGIDKKKGELETDKFEHDTAQKNKRADIAADSTVQGINRDLQVERAQMAAEQERKRMQAEAEHRQREMDFEAWQETQRMQAEKERVQRQAGFDAWQDKQRMLEAQDEADYMRRRREQQERQKNQLSAAEHEAQMKEIARRIEQSDLDWREKLDAYARLQRGVAFQDQMNERAAEVDAKAREARIAAKLRHEDMQALGEIRHEEDLRRESLEKQRFARELEMRRQKMQEEAAQLEAQFERERALAQEQENRQKAREEVETLRLMLEYLTRSGEQQVNAEILREARKEAQIAWEREHAEDERKAAEERDERRQEREQELALRMAELAQRAEETRNAAKGKDGEPAVAIKGMEEVLQQLDGIRKKMEGTSAPAAQTGSGLDAWFASLLSHAAAQPAAPAYVPQPAAPVYAPQPAAPAYAPQPTGGVVCGNCRKTFDANSIQCPYCKWIKF